MSESETKANAPNPRVRVCHFAFTHNNYDDVAVKRYQEAVGSSVRYIVFGYEESSTGTPHLQGHVFYNHAKTLPSVVKRYPGAHISIARDPAKSIAYCKKGGKFEEYGVPLVDKITARDNSKAATEEYFKKIRLAAETGNVDAIPDSLRVRNPANLRLLRHIALSRDVQVDTDAQHEWYCGPSGTGKSRKAREENPGLYLKMCNKWWCGYESQDVVLIEDFDTDHAKLVHHLKVWADRYPFPAEFKGFTRVIRPKKIIVTANYTPKDIWHRSGDLDPILRRFKVTHFGTVDEDNGQFILGSTHMC